MGKGQEDEHDGHGIDDVEYRDGEGEDLGQSGVGQDHADHGEEDSPAAVAQFGTKTVKILAAGADESHTDIKAGDDKDGGQNHAAHRAEEQRDDVGQGFGAVAGIGHRAARDAADMGQHGIDDQQYRPGHETGPDGAADNGLLFRDAPGADIQGDDDTEGQGGNGVHGLVSVQETGGNGLDGSVPAFSRDAVALQRVEKTGRESNDDQNHQNGAQDLAQTVGELFGAQGNEERQPEENHRIDQLEEPDGGVRSHERGNGHFEGCTGGAGNGQTGADGQIGHDGKDLGKGRMDPLSQLIHAACPGHGDDAQYRQTNRADGKANDGEPGHRPGLGGNARRENQVARSKEHGEQGKTNQ